MFALPIFETAHPRWAKSMTNSMHEAGYTDYEHSECVVFDPEAPHGIVYCTGHNINYELHPLFNEITYDARHSLIVDATNKKSKLMRNRKFKKSLWYAPSFLFTDEYQKPFRDVYLLNDYVVCDSAEQVMAHYKFLADDPDNTYFIALTPIVKKHQPANGGWRWHKWGPYIGNHKPSCEYIYDEPNIDYVFTYHVYKFKKCEPLLKTEHFSFVQIGRNTFQVYSNETNLNIFTVDLEKREVTIINDDISINKIHITVATIPEDITAENMGEWVELNYKDTWL